MSFAPDYGRSMEVGASAPEVSVELAGRVRGALHGAWNGVRHGRDGGSSSPTTSCGPIRRCRRRRAAWPRCRSSCARASARFPDLHFGEPDPPALAVSGDVVSVVLVHGGHAHAARSTRRASRRRASACASTASTSGRCATGGSRVYRAFYDMNDLARQLGIVPPPGSRAERGMVALQRLQARLAAAMSAAPTATTTTSRSSAPARRVHRGAPVRAARRARRADRAQARADAYKTVCTHFIQSSATPTIERLGLAPLLDERGRGPQRHRPLDARQRLDQARRRGRPVRLQRHAPHARPDPAASSPPRRRAWS